MNQIIITSLFVFCSIFAFGQDSEDRSVDSFHGVSISASVDAELVKGNQNEVHITVENYDLDDVKTEVIGGILKVGMKSKKNWNMGWSKKRKVKAVITYTDELDYIAVGSSADLTADHVIESDELELKVSSSGDMTIEVDVNELDASVSSSGDLYIKGFADKATVSASSSADFEGKKLKVGDANLKASSSADIAIHVSGNLKAIASSSADIEYYGNPTNKDISKSSGADVDGH